MASDVFHEFSLEKVQRFLRPERKRDLDPKRIAALLPIEPGQAVADIGCGPGFFSIALARRTSPGLLYALDIVPEFVAIAKKRLAAAKVKNAKLIVSEELDFKLPEGSLDGAFLAFVVHHANDQQAFMRLVDQTLKPGGWAAVLDWAKSPMVQGPHLHERLSQREVINLARGAGLRLSNRANFSERYYLLLFQKPVS
jgi:ubiquinone/menaquinone biosynthesis C-methylase UbiE